MANKVNFSILVLVVLILVTDKSDGCAPVIGFLAHSFVNLGASLAMHYLGRSSSGLQSNASSELIYLGNDHGKSLYAVLELPMDWETAVAHCNSWRMNLISANQTEVQKELLTSAINKFAESVEINVSDTPIRYWTSARHNSTGFIYKLVEEEDLVSDQCGSVTVRGTKFIPGYVSCSARVDITICESDI